MDKLGHSYGAYQFARYTYAQWEWTGVSHKTNLALSTISSFALISAIEIYDGFSAKWGASGYDLIANGLGSGLFLANELLWREQRIQMRASFHPTDFPRTHSSLLGSNLLEEALKDYNGHTFWLSFRVSSFLPESKFKERYPRWLNLAVGYGADGLIGGYGIEPQASINAREYRQWYIAPSIDFMQIKTRKRWLKAVFFIANSIHFPLPALEFNRKGAQIHWLHF